MNKLKPWFKPDVVKYLSGLLQSDWTILETGCGGSTIWYAKRVAKVISFEHDPAWALKVQEYILSREIKNVTLHLDVNYPKEGIKGFKKNKFDFISIDGRGRRKSIESSIPYLKSGGYLLLDDSQRERYQNIFLLDSWSNVKFTRHDKQTIIWRKP